MPHPKDAASFNAIALSGPAPSTDIPAFNLSFSMPPQALRKHVATLIARGLYQAKLPWLPGEKIVAGDLEGVANFVIGGLIGLEQADHGKTN